MLALLLWIVQSWQPKDVFLQLDIHARDDQANKGLKVGIRYPRLRMLAYMSVDIVQVVTCWEQRLDKWRTDEKKAGPAVLDIPSIHKHTAIIAVVCR